MDKYSQQNKGSVLYIGIAADETKRLDNKYDEFKRYPLVEWGITEQECLKGCYKAGFDWGGMYEHLDRVSCMYCRNKNLKELRNIRKYYPDVWEKLMERQTRTNLPYKTNGTTIFDLEKRFCFEGKRISQGMSINGREFYRKLKEVLRSDTNG